MAFSLSDELFFELLQVSLGTREALSRIPKSEEWVDIFAVARRQMVSGICFAGVASIYIAKDEINSSDCQACNLEEAMYFKWARSAISTQNRNAEIVDRCLSLQNKLKENNIKSSVLKGIGIAYYYCDCGPRNTNGTLSLSSVRSAGDIDLFVDCGRRRAIELARSMVSKDILWDIKHLHLPIYKKTSVEIHYEVEVSINIFRNRRLKKWFSKPEVVNMIFGETQNGIVTPTTEFNLFYIYLHAFRHFLYEGMVFKQLTDCYVILRASDPGMRERTMRLFKDFGMLKYIGGMMWVMKYAFGMREQDLFCTPDDSEGEFILDQVLHGIKAGCVPAAGCQGGTASEVKPGTTGAKVATMANVMRNNLRLATHYPSEVLWAPIWFVYHKVWKLFAR